MMSKTVTPKKQHLLMYENEKDFFWFTTLRNNEKYFLMKEFSNTVLSSVKILDAGCGTGYFVKFLKEIGFDAKGFDYSDVAISLCQRRGLKINKDVYSVNIFDEFFLDDTFDCVTLNDVLFAFSVEDADLILGKLNKVLKPGGILIGQTAAFDFLYSKHDEIAGTKHRYNKGEIKKILKNNNFSVEKLGYRNFFLFIPFMLKRILSRGENAKESSDLKKISKLSNYLLKAIFGLDDFFLRYVNYPYGGTVFFIARKIGKKKVL